MPLAKKQQNAKRLTSGRVRVGTIKKAVATAGNISAKNKLGRPLKKRIEPHPSWAISARKKQCPKKRSPQIFSSINKALLARSSHHHRLLGRAQIIPLKNCSRSLLLYSFLRAYLLRASTTSPPPCSPQQLVGFVSGFLNFGGSLSLCHFSCLIKKSKPLKTKREGKQVPCQKIYCLKLQGGVKN